MMSKVVITRQQGLFTLNLNSLKGEKITSDIQLTDEHNNKTLSGVEHLEVDGRSMFIINDSSSQLKMVEIRNGATVYLLTNNEECASYKTNITISGSDREQAKLILQGKWRNVGKLSLDEVCFVKFNYQGKSGEIKSEIGKLEVTDLNKMLKLGSYMVKHFSSKEEVKLPFNHMEAARLLKINKESLQKFLPWAADSIGAEVGAVKGIISNFEKYIKNNFLTVWGVCKFFATDEKPKEGSVILSYDVLEQIFLYVDTFNFSSDDPKSEVDPIEVLGGNGEQSTANSVME